MKSGQAMPIPQGEFTIGRADSAYIHLEDASVSRRHAQLLNNDDGLFIEDLGSANGTAAHGSYISSRLKIDIGDLLYIGAVPFRVDPEVAGESEMAASVGMRKPTRPYMRRDTERIPPMGSEHRVVETLSPEMLLAPQVSPANDMDAEHLNAITMREAQPVAAAEASDAGSEVFATPQESRAPQTLPIPAPQRQASSKSQPQQGVRISVPAPIPNSAPASTTSIPQPTKTTPPPTETNWGWWVMIFLAGMGTGLLLGLYFARLFFEMGGKPALLP